MDLVMEDKVANSEQPLPLALASSSLQMSAQMANASPQISSQVCATQPSFTSGVPTLLPPSQMSYSALTVSPSHQSSNATSKYAQLLQVIEELGKDIRPTYSGSKSSAERLKRGITHSRILVRECLMETERNNARN